MSPAATRSLPVSRAAPTVRWIISSSFHIGNIRVSVPNVGSMISATLGEVEASTEERRHQQKERAAADEYHPLHLDPIRQHQAADGEHRERAQQITAEALHRARADQRDADDDRG